MDWSAFAQPARSVIFGKGIHFDCGMSNLPNSSLLYFPLKRFLLWQYDARDIRKMEKRIIDLFMLQVY
jgi:hypothetical protein